MAARKYMTEYRKKQGLDIQSMAILCGGGISKLLLEMLERSDEVVTHHMLAKRIGKAYKLTKEQTEGLMPEHYRKSSPNYNPNLYREEV